MSGPSLYPNIKRTNTGYKVNSPDVNNKQNIIPSNNISMKEDNGEPLEKGNIKGTGLTTGNTKIMKPGKNYKFPGDEEVLETPIKHHVKDKNGNPIAHWISKSKFRKDGTLKKVVTKSKRGSGNKEHKSWWKGGKYKSVIKFDDEGRIKSAKSNRTKNKHKKSTQRLSKSNWIKRDLTPYTDDPNITSTKDY